MANRLAILVARLGRAALPSNVQSKLSLTSTETNIAKKSPTVQALKSYISLETTKIPALARFRPSPFS